MSDTSWTCCEGRVVRSNQASFLPDGLLNALIESFTIHARNLVHFLDPEGQKESDVLADHFLSDPSAWHSARDKMPASLVQARRRANKEVAHLTFDRLAVTDEAKPWDCPVIVDAITERFEGWKRLVPPGIADIIDDVRDRKGKRG